MKKVFFIIITLLIILLFFLNFKPNKKIVTSEQITYITITCSGNISHPGTFKVPSDISEEEVLNLVGIKNDTIWKKIEIYDGANLYFDYVDENPIIIATATYEQLDSLPLIGEAKANKILEYLKTNGSFKDWNDFFSLVGIKNEDSQFEIKKRALLR